MRQGKLTRKNRLTCLLLAAVMLLGLTACSGETATAQTESTQQSGQTSAAESSAPGESAAESSDELGFLATYTTLELDLSYYSGVQAMNGKLYLTGGYSDMETGAYQNVVATLDGTGALEDTVAIADGSNRSVNAMTVGNDGILAVVYEWREEPAVQEESAADGDWTDVQSDETGDWTQTDTEDFPAGWDTGEAEAGSAGTQSEAASEEAAEDTQWIYEEETTESTGREVYVLEKYSMDGELLFSQDIELPEDGDMFYVAGVAMDGAGNAYYYNDTTIYACDSDLKQQYTVTAPNWINALMASPDGRIWVSYYDENYNQALAELDTENQTLHDAVDLGLNTLNRNYQYYFGLDGFLYGFSSTDLYRCDLNAGTSELVLNWLDWDIDSSSASCVSVLEDGSILLFGRNSMSDAPEVATVQQTPLSELPQKTEITFGTSYVSYALRSAILNFNKQNENYRIQVVDYSTYSTADDYMGGYSQLDRDVISGNCPDIIDLSNLSSDKYVSKGILADLYTLMSEETVAKEDFVQNYLRVMERDGSLYSLSPSFSVMTMVGAAAYVGSESGWTLEEFVDAAQSLPDNALVIDYTTRADFLSMMLYYTYDQFIDRETGECAFDSQEFIDLLNACMLFPEDYSFYEEYHNIDSSGATMAVAVNEDYYTSEYNKLRSGEKLLQSFGIYGFDDLQWGSGAALADDLTLVGFPGAPGNGAVLMNSEEYGISANSEHQDVAWEFLCTLLSEDYLNSYGGSLPVIQEILDIKAQEAMQNPYYLDENGEKVEYENSSMTILTQEQVDKVYDLIENATCQYRYDEQLQSIVSEEAAAFFAGQKTAETVADLIQNRVQIYIDEQS